MESINSGRIDLMCGPVSVTEERKEVMDFCDTTYSGGAALIVREDRFADGVLSDNSDIEEKLNSARIGVMQGTTSVIFLEDNYPGAEVFEFEAIGDAAEALKANKIDDVMAPYSTAKNFERYMYAYCKVRLLW